MYSPEETKKLKILDFRFVPKYRARYWPVFTPRFTPIGAPSRWDALIEKRRLQMHKYTKKELEKFMPALLERWEKRHGQWAEEAKAHEEAIKAITEGAGRTALRYRPVYRPVYHPIYARRLSQKVKYRCPECNAGYLWMNDFLSHVKKEHPDRYAIGLSKVSR